MASSERIHGTLPLSTAEETASRIESDATLLTSGFGSVGYPKAVPLALAESDRDLSLTVVSGGSVGDEIDVVLVEADAIARRYPYQATKPARAAVNDGTIAFQDRNVSTLGDEVHYGNLVEPDVAVVEAVAVGENWFIPSTSIGLTPAFVAAADHLVVEVNEAQPLALRQFHDSYRRGPPPNREPIPLTAPDERIAAPEIEFAPEKLESVIQTDHRDDTYSFREPTADDRAIATNLAEFLRVEVERSSVFDDALHLQFGVGSLGNALMSALSALDIGDRDLIYFGEVIQDGLLDMLDDGSVASASATSLALSADGQDRLFENIDHYAEGIVLRPADISNNPALIDRFGVVGVNSALEVDIYGHVNSTHVNGTRVVNGIGGSGDFNRNALVAVLALSSTALGGERSRVVPMVPHTDHTEHDIDVVITERGVADLRGTSPRERAEEIVTNCAHPDFRPGLEAYLNRTTATGGHVPHDLETVFSRDED